MEIGWVGLLGQLLNWKILRKTSVSNNVGTLAWAYLKHVLMTSGGLFLPYLSPKWENSHVFILY